MCDRNVFERDPLERARIAQAFHGAENLNAGQMSIGIIVGGYALTLLSAPKNSQSGKQSRSPPLSSCAHPAKHDNI
jgi:hypothetical protein